MLACAKIKDSKGKSNPYGALHILLIDQDGSVYDESLRIDGCKGRNDARVPDESTGRADRRHGAWYVHRAIPCMALYKMNPKR